MATVARLPILPSASPRPTVVVVLPSPRGVGVIAETTTYFAFGRSSSAAIASSLILATSSPNASSRWGPMPIFAAMSGIESKRALRAISRSVGNSTFMAPPPLGQPRQHLPAPPLRRLDLVEREHVKPSHAELRIRDSGHQRAKESSGLVSTGPEHARHPARVAAQEPGRVGDADLRRYAQQAHRVGHAGHADVDRQRHSPASDPLHPALHRLGVEAH